MNELEKRYPLKGFIDTHLHTAPDTRLRLLNDIEAAKAAYKERMRAIVIKNHTEPTSGRAVIAHHITNFPVFGGVCLNSSVGGLNADAVETAAFMGGKVIWLPTISKNEVNINNEDVLEDIFNIIVENDLVLATGHLKTEEIFRVLDLARRVGLEKIIVNHPLTRVVGVNVEDQKEMSRKAYLEHCYVACLPGHDGLAPEKLAIAIKEVGARRCIMATDLGQIHNPSPIEGLKVFIKVMMELGISWKEIKLMCQVNPSHLFFK